MTRLEIAALFMAQMDLNEEFDADEETTHGREYERSCRKAQAALRHADMLINCEASTAGGGV